MVVDQRMVGRRRSHCCLITDCRYIGVDLHRIPSEASEGDLSIPSLQPVEIPGCHEPPIYKGNGWTCISLRLRFSVPKRGREKKAIQPFRVFFFSFFFWPLLKNTLRLPLLDDTTAWIWSFRVFWGWNFSCWER